jgi:excisionase family DNA binding protein
MNDILFTPIRLNELENLIEKSVERGLSKINTQPQVHYPQTDIIFIDEVCRITNLKRATVYTLVYHKKIPFIKPAGVKKLLFSRKVITEWLQSGRIITEQKTDDNFNNYK